MLKTKIVCTLGPASSTKKVVSQMIANGMSCARINMSHGTLESALPQINLIKNLRNELKKPVAIMIDTKGPECRIGDFENGHVFLKSGQTFTISKKYKIGNENGCFCSYPSLFYDLKVGNKILLNDGLITLKVVKLENEEIKTKVVFGGKLSNRKSMFIPKVKLGIPFLGEEDKKNLKLAIETDADYIAASFVSSKEEVLQMRKFLDANGGKNIKIIAKIENALGVKNANEILDFCDGLMVARGDLGVEMPIEKLPHVQKELIKKAQQKGKLAITATEMLESMIEKSRPTRAEVNDVANAVYDRTSAIMLSGETAVGKHPALVVKTMAKIAKEAESTLGIDSSISCNKLNTTDSISHSTCQTAAEIAAKAIVVFTCAGGTAFMVSRFKPKQSIIAITLNEKALHQLALCYGVVPVLTKKLDNIEEMFKTATSVVKNLKLAQKSDKIVVTAGIPLGKAGETNIIKIETLK